MEPTEWTVNCVGWECAAPREGRVFTRAWSQPLVIKGTRAEAVRKARAAGWETPGRAMSWETAGKNSTASWWCPRHVATAREAAVRAGAKRPQ